MESPSSAGDSTLPRGNTRDRDAAVALNVTTVVNRRAVFYSGNRSRAYSDPRMFYL